MIKRLAASLLVLATSAWAQPVEAPQEAPASAATQAETAVADAPAEPVSVAPLIPTDPTELLAYALANAREPAQCRFAFTRSQTTAAQVAWNGADADVVVRFDPRLPIGERWTVVSATRQQRALERSFAREDRKGLPFDLMALTAEGEYSFENPAMRAEHPDRVVYSFQPRMVPARIADETGQGIIEQLVGEIEVSREGRILSSTLREPPETAVRALGIVRVRRALLRNGFTPDANGHLLADSGTQMFSMSAMLTQTEVTTSFRFTEVESICDPAEVARIAEAEAAAVAAGSSRRR
ncbi:MAG: hypothetical protein H7124_09805 [Phycisphaerales bacterium]|nr:hypothetical protein [Hyphomonadaceae bacterium]